ncbi:MAG: DUF502 domain-containing protein [Bacteroidetes bacterium]|nr:DUF502 domain-containing protein [Bacteroidota bacterium]
MKKLLAYFFQGLLYTVPLAVTVFVLYKVFEAVDGILQTYVKDLLSFEIPGIGLLIILILVTFVGFIGKYIITQPIISFFNRIIKRAPLIKVIYSAVKDLLSAFVGKEKKFNRPVLVKVNNVSNLEKLGFVTQTDLKEIGLTDKKVVVYFPHSYAFSGEHYIVPTDCITPLDIPPAEVMKFIVSGGVTKF